MPAASSATSVSSSTIRTRPSACAPLPRVSDRSRSTARWEVDREGRTLADLRFHRDRAADLLGEAEDLAEAKTSPLTEALGREEGLEHTFHRFRGHAGAGVSDAQGDMLAFQTLRRSREHDVLGADPSFPPSFIASRALKARLRSREL